MCIYIFLKSTKGFAGLGWLGRPQTRSLPQDAQTALSYTAPPGPQGWRACGLASDATVSWPWEGGPQKLCSSLGLRPRPELSISPQRWRPPGTLCLDSDSTPQDPLALCSEHMALVARAVAGQALVSASGDVNAALAGPPLPGECGSGPSWLGVGWHAPCGSFGD